VGVGVVKTPHADIIVSERSRMACLIEFLIFNL
jgi:hypothetical protein